MKKRKKASEVYGKQNRLIHKAMHAAGYPYATNKDLWVPLMREMRGQKTDDGRRTTDVRGLSDLTLGERHALLADFQKKGYKIFAPAVPVKIRGWRKGDPDIEYEYRMEDDPQIRMIYAMWNEMGYQPKGLRAMCLRMFQRDDVRWLTDKQLSRLVNFVKMRAEVKGYGNYYRRNF